MTRRGPPAAMVPGVLNACDRPSPKVDMAPKSLSDLESLEAPLVTCGKTIWVPRTDLHVLVGVGALVRLA